MERNSLSANGAHLYGKRVTEKRPDVGRHIVSQFWVELFSPALNDCHVMPVHQHENGDRGALPKAASAKHTSSAMQDGVIANSQWLH